MPHGEMQLIAYGSQDIYLTGNPSITFFKFVYKKHTNFASEYIRQDFTTLPSYNTNSRSKLRCKIDRNGDLIHDIYLVYDLPDIFSGPETEITHSLGLPSISSSVPGEYFRWINNLGENIIHTVEILLDGQVLDRQYGLWLNIWNELTIPKSKRHAYDTMIGNISTCNNPSLYYGNYEGPPNETNNLPTIPSRRLYIPLPFWFCRNPGLAIPLIALQYNELYINIEFNQLNDLFTVGNPPISPDKIFDENYLNNFGNNSFSNTLGFPVLLDNNIQLKDSLVTQGYSSFDLFWKFINSTNENSSTWSQQAYLDVNYIFLDEDERKKYAQINHEYLITQVQTSHFILNNVNESIKGSVNILNLLFQHPVKELIWVLRRNDAKDRNQWNNYTTSLYNYDFNDSTNNFTKTFSNPNPGTNLFHIQKAIMQSNYIRGIANGFDSGGTRNDTCIDGFFDANDYYNKNSDSFNQINNIMYNAKLVFNGNDRFSSKDNVFFNYLQPFKYHTSTPSPGVNVFSFALNPEDDQPSGTCNMSRIDLVQLELSLRWLFHKTNTDCNAVDLNEGYELFIFGVNYNVLRILGGMGGLVFSN
jgi:hypothetical protein